MTLPDATLVSFVYDERPTLNLMRSLLRDARRWPNLAIWDQSKDALITRMRSTAATHYLEQGSGDVLIMVDHDIGWEAGDLEHITRVCLDMKGVVGGVFPKRGFGQGVPIRWGQYGEYKIPDDRVVECLYVATGFMAIHRDVLVALEKTLPMTIHDYRPFFEAPTITHDDGRIENLSEDYDFCNKARAAGFKVWADLRPQLSHFGTHLFTLADTSFVPPSPGGATIVAKDVTKPCEVKAVDGADMELWVDHDDRKVSSTLIRGQAWEPEVINSLREHLRPTDRLLEIGSHIGYHTVQLAKLVKDVVAVEPIPQNLELLRKNVALHGLTNVDVWPMAVVGEGDLRKTARMLRVFGNSGASHLLLDEDMQGVEVGTCRLADLPGPFDVVKLDAEGAEWLICSGESAVSALAETRVLLTEYCESQLLAVSGVSGDSYLNRLEELGFTLDFDRDLLPKGKAYCNLMLARA